MISRNDYMSLCRPEGAQQLRQSSFGAQDPLEHAKLAVFQHQILTEEPARLFAQEFERETERLAREDIVDRDAAQTRLQQITAELDNLCQNLLSGITSPILRMMIAEREAEKVRICLVPVIDGATTTSEWKEALWARFYKGAPLT